MKAKWSGIGIVDGRGKLNGTVMSKNRYGAYARTKVTPVNPQTTEQQNARSLLSSVAQAWRNLTQAQRDSWIAASKDVSRTNIFGDGFNPTGFNLFNMLNINLQLINAGQPFLEDVPEMDSPNPILSLQLNSTLSNSNFEIEDSPGAVTANNTWLIYATRPVSEGVQFVKSEYRLITVAPGSIMFPYDLLADYQSRFGTIPPEKKIFVQAVPVHNDSGIRGIPIQTEGITSVAV